MAVRPKNNMRLEGAIASYLERITNMGQVKQSVSTAYHTLSRFQDAWAAAHPRDPNPYVHLITDSDMDDYCYGRDGIRKGVKSASFNRYRSVLVKFFDYCVTKRWADVSPMVEIEKARPEPAAPPLMLTAEELFLLPNYCSQPVERIACALGANTGLRSNDIKHLTIFDACLDTGFIQTEIRKSRKYDAKPIPLELRAELIRWLDLYAGLMDLPSRDDLPGDWLLVPAFDYWPPGFLKGGEGKLKLRPKDVHAHPYHLVQRPLARMGFEPAKLKGSGFHTLRRSSARAFFEYLRDKGQAKDYALMTVKDFLNHRHTQQTEHYLGLNSERAIRDALLKDKSFLGQLAQNEQSRIADKSPLRRIVGA